jgi:hypothetical protein
MREAVRRAARAGLIVHVDRMAIDCAMMCTGCGWLRWPEDPTAGDPQRRTPASSDTPMCPHCGSRAWLDLQHVPTWDALQQVERYEADARRGRPIGIAGGVAAVALVGVAALAAVIASPVLAGVLGVCAIGGFSFAARAIAAVPAPRRLVPRRWSMVVPPRGVTNVVARDRVVTDARLRAPLSGRECVAYEVAVRNDDDISADWPTWSLVEQRNAAFAIAGERVGADDVLLELDRERSTAEGEAVQNYLSARGIDPHAPDLVLYETIVEPGATMELRRAAKGNFILVTPARAAAR